MAVDATECEETFGLSGSSFANGECATHERLEPEAQPVNNQTNNETAT